MDVEKCDVVVQNPLRLSVCHRHQKDPVPKQSADLPLEREAAQSGDGVRQLIVAVNMKISLVFSRQDSGSDHADHPDDAQNVIRVFMGDENVVNGV